MDALEVPLDRTMYGQAVVLRVAHRFSGAFFVDARGRDGEWILKFTSRTPAPLPDDLLLRVQTEALDEALRQRIRAETDAIHHALIEAALRESLPDTGGA